MTCACDDSPSGAHTKVYHMGEAAGSEVVQRIVHCLAGGNAAARQLRKVHVAAEEHHSCVGHWGEKNVLYIA